MRVGVKPELLRWAIERGGIDANDLSRRFPLLPQWEKGAVAPTLKQLEKFARATRAPIGYLFLPEPPQESIPIPDFRTVAGANGGRPSPELLDTIYVCQQRQEWYREFARSIGEAPRTFVGSVQIGDGIEGVAEQIRSHLDFDLEARRKMPTWTDALRDFISRADAAGVMVMCSGVVLNNNNRHMDPNEFRGFAIADDLAPLVFINGADTKAAQMFTLAHELAHIWLGQSAVSDAQALRLPDHKVERWCDQVAAELLVPLAAIRTEFQKRRDLRDEVARLARQFKVSTLVVLRRIHDAGGISRERLWQEYEAEVRRLNERPKSSGGNFYLTQAARVSKRFARALIISTLEGQTLHRDAFRLLGFSKLDTFNQLGQSLGVL